LGRSATKKKLKIRKSSVVPIIGLSYMAAPITAGLSHRRPASAGRCSYSCVARDGVRELTVETNVTYLDGK